MAKDRIPPKDSAFNAFIKSTNDYLNAGGSPANYERLGLTTAENTQWSDYRSDWETAYLQYSDLNQRTRTITRNKNNVKAQFTGFARPLLNRMSASPDINASDRSALNLRQRDATPTKRSAIADIPVMNLAAMGGGRIDVLSRTGSDSNRASMHPLADGIEVKYAIGTATPAAVGDCSFYHISPKARFHLEAGAENAGKRLYAFARYVNLSSPSDNGPWTNVLNVVIS